MYDDAGFIVLSTISALVCTGCLVALIWAAIQDGREERAFRMRR
jgi:hypothetical protein